MNNVIKKRELCVDLRHFEAAEMFKALCDATRFMILELLQDGEKCACDLLESIDIKQPTLSHHMKIMVKSGIVSARKSGKWTYYSISDKGSKKAIELLKKATTATFRRRAEC